MQGEREEAEKEREGKGSVMTTGKGMRYQKRAV